jgi:hypothetical protein
MSSSVLYLYGLLRAGADTSGLEGVEEASDVFLVERDGLGCAATMVVASEYERRLDSSPDHVAWLTPRAWRHHNVLRQLHLRAAVVPLKFGTLCACADDVRAMLAELPPTVVELLSRVEEKDEWTLRIAADETAISTALLDADNDLRNLQQDIARLPEGRAYFARKQLQKVTADRVVAYLDDIEAAVHRRLAALGAEVAHMPRPRRGDRQNGAVAESAVLMRRTDFGEMEATLRELEDAQGAVRFELVGPWPPYSFASISQSMPPAYESHRPL